MSKRPSKYIASFDCFDKSLMKKKDYREPKEIIRMTKSQRSDTKKNNLIVEDKRMGVHEINRKNNLTPRE